MMDRDTKSLMLMISQSKLLLSSDYSRILRQENYLIALFNKDLLDLRVRIPIPTSLQTYMPPSLMKEQVDGLPSSTADSRKFITFGANGLTKALEWNLRFCLMGFLFDRRGQVKREFVRDKGRKDLVAKYVE
jgi:autophagy-related protein 9